VYHLQRYQNSELINAVSDYIKRSVGYRLGWTNEETDKNLMQFEYLANIIIIYDFGKRDFPVHATLYEDDKVHRILELIIGDPSILNEVFPNVDKKRLANAIKTFEQMLSGMWGLGLGDYYTSRKLSDFIGKYADNSN
jgi:hypothetical protein